MLNTCQGVHCNSQDKTGNALLNLILQQFEDKNVLCISVSRAHRIARLHVTVQHLLC